MSTPCADLAKQGLHRSRLRDRPMVAGAHTLCELPDEITTPGPSQVRAMVINSGNPVISGPDGAKLDAALAELELLVVVDFVQRESHRYAHWLLPAVHWLERAPTTSACTRHRRSSWRGRGNSSPRRLPPLRTAIRSSWGIANTGTR